MAIVFLSTLAAQMGSAWFNSRRSKAHSAKMARLQQVYEEKATWEGIENARAEFDELCAFQREMEADIQRHRLDLIRNNHEQSLLMDAYEGSLRNWPLLVPPYVIANAPLTLSTTEHQPIPLNCLLTTSTNISFNNAVINKLEDYLAVFCSKYWNTSTSKSIRFLQEVWRDTSEDLSSRHKDIYAHLKNVPTLLISPIIKNDTLLFRFYWWGLSTDPSDAHINDINELNPELSIPITKGMKFTSETIATIVSECIPKLEAFISFFADLYYWNFYRQAPSLPNLFKKGVLSLGESDISDLQEGYSTIIEDNLKSTNPIRNNILIENLKPICSLEYIASVISESDINSIDDKEEYAFLGHYLECAIDKLPTEKVDNLIKIYSNSENKIHRSYICASLPMILEDFKSHREVQSPDNIVIEFNKAERFVSVYCDEDFFICANKKCRVKYNYKICAVFVPEYLCTDNVKKIAIKGRGFNDFYNCLLLEETQNKYVAELSISAIEDIATQFSKDIRSCKISKIEDAPDFFNALEKYHIDDIYSFEIESDSNSWKKFFFFDRIEDTLESIFVETNEIIIK